MKSDKREPSFGGWNAEEIEETYKGSSGAGSDFELASKERFLRGVVAAVRRREAIESQREGERSISVFLLKSDQAGQTNLTLHPMLDAGKSKISGSIWFVNEAVRSGWGRSLPSNVPTEIFQIVTEQLQVGEVPAVLVDPSGTETSVRYYPQGLSSPNDCELMRLDYSDLKLADILSIVDTVHSQCLVTPDAQSSANKLWQDASQYRPFRNAENKIQAYLKPGLAAALPTCQVYEEQSGIMGRTDIQIRQHDPLDRAKVVHLAVLELKVLRSFSEGGNDYSDEYTQKIIAEGLRQVYSYRNEHEHRIGLLCCFDMRVEDAIDLLEGFGEESDLIGVAIKSWRIYSSSRQARTGEYPM